MAPLGLGLGPYLMQPSGGATVPAYIQTFITAAGGTSVFDYFYHSSCGVVSSSGNLVSWSSVTSAPDLLPTNTVTVSGGSVNTNGTNSYVAPASANAKFRLDSSQRTDLICGEMQGTPTFWGCWTNAGQFEAWKNDANKWNLYNMSAPQGESPKAYPPNGTKSCWIITNNNTYSFQGLNTAAMWLDFVGRGPNANAWGTPGQTTGSLQIGQAGGNYGVCKITSIIRLNIPLTKTIRDAYETMCAVDGVSFYTQAGSTGSLLAMGDSLTAGTGATTTSQATPISTSVTFYPAQLQVGINAASKAVDSWVYGVGSQKVSNFLSEGIVDRACSMMSSARAAQSLTQTVVFWMGTNDIVNGDSAATIYTNITTVVSKFHAAGAKIAVCTIIPRGGFYTTGPTANETTRLNLNTSILSNAAGADVVIDLSQAPDTTAANYKFWANPTGGSDTITSNLTYYNADTVHGTDTSYTQGGKYIWSQISSIV